MPVKRGIAVWISGFLTFLAAFNVFGALIYLISEGRDAVVKPYLIVDIIGELRVETYLWISLTTTFIFLGLTSIITHRRLPPDPEIVKMFVKVGGNLAAQRKTLEATKTELSEGLEINKTTNEELFKRADTNLENARKETLDMLEKQGKTIQKVRQDMVLAIETKVGEAKEETLGALEKQRKAIEEAERSNERSAEAIKRQRAGLEDMRTRLEKIEREMMPPQPRLKSQDDPQEIKGIGPRLGEKLRSIGITNVGELIIADPAIIYEKTRVSRQMAERLQTVAQLLMVPGVDDNDAELLMGAGVTSRRQLAAQDPVTLGRKIGEIAKTYIEEEKISKDENPTIEEISFWIKMAKY